MRKHQQNTDVRPLTPDEETGYQIRNDPAIIAAREAERLAKIAEYAARKKAISDNLPSWQAVSNAIDGASSVAQLGAIVKKIARVLYWEVKNSEL